MADVATQLSFENAVRATSQNIKDLAAGLPAKARLAMNALLHIEQGSLTVRIPDGRSITFEGKRPGPVAAIALHNWNLPKQAFAIGTIGVAETFMDGDWDSPDVTAFLEFFITNNRIGQELAGAASIWMILFQRFRHWLNENTPTRAKRNIAAHYDLGNDFYKLWLDPSMTYSAALYQTGANSLEAAQLEKYRALAASIGIEKHHRVLEIGCGWGGFAEYAARKIGCHVTCLTISQEQLDYARQRIDAAGLSDLVDLRFQDYRDETGSYDRIVSIEMFEAVGEKYWDTYFHTLRQRLNRGGKAGLQIITIREEAWGIYKRTPDFIQRYIFPGGMLPTPTHLHELADRHQLAFAGRRSLAEDYATTLAAWRSTFVARWAEVRSLGFDERFRKMWEFYLQYCEAGFKAGNTDVFQFALEHADSAR
jgi:cyclopropane-fatty-acyl-phospholipid synthase